MKKRDHRRKRKAASRHFSTIIVVLMMILGIALLLYPTVANQINNSLNDGVIEEYQRKVQELGANEYQAILEAARKYNSELFERTPYIGTLTEERRQIYESLLDVAGNGIIGYIEIEKPQIYLAIYHGTEESVLQTGIGHLEASSLPVTGESVHVVLSGHSGLPSARLFTDLDQLEMGDTFTLHVLNETLTYQVEGIRRVLPDELENLHIEEGQELCTLMTCTPYGVNTHRLVVLGRRIETPVQKEETSPVRQALTSAWNWRFVILPAAVFAAIVTAVVLIRRRKKKKQRSKLESKRKE